MEQKRGGAHILLRALIVLLSVITVFGAAVAIAVVLFEQKYATLIYPGITIGSFNVGDMTPAEAEVSVQAHYDRMLGVINYGNSTKWFATWPALGIRVNAREAVQQAFNIGRQGNPQQRLAAWRSRATIIVTFSYDAAMARKTLEQHRVDVAVAPQSARVVLADGAAIVQQGVPGLDLDPEATLSDSYARLLREEPVTVQTQAVAPIDNGAREAANQLNLWLQHPLTLTMWWDSHWITRSIAPVERMSWVSVGAKATRNSVGDERLLPVLHAQGIHDTLEQVNADINPAAAMRVDEVTAMVLDAIAKSEPTVWFVVPHGDVRYTIKRGDTFDSIGDAFGMPTALTISANPDLWAQGGFVAGQQITIPAQSVMMPVPITPDNQQRIEVDLTHQRLTAFDRGAAVLSTSISSGIPKWRTLIGVFQVQEKVDDAVNKLAHITMPNWLSIYDIGEPGNSLTNGIHALPELGGGRRLWAGYLGHPVSFGCVVMDIKEAAWLYQWVKLGTPVLIYGQTPPTELNYDDLIEARDKTEQKP